MTYPHQIGFTYRNYKGEVEMRCITPIRVEFIREPGYGYQPGWFLTGLDRDRNEIRSFSLSHIVLPESGKLELEL